MIWFRDRFALTCVIAAALHGLLFFRVTGKASSPVERPAMLEVDLVSEMELSEPEEQIVGAATISPRAEHAVSAPLAAPLRAAAKQDMGEVTTSAAPEAGLELPVPEGSAEGQSPSPSRPAVRLFLGRDALAELVREKPAPKKKPEKQPPPSVGLLSEGLAAQAAEQGAAPSSPAVSAGYRAAQLGPRDGTAVLEIRADASGTVISVRVVGDDVSGSWTAVAEELLARLAGRVLRIPEGAKGMVTRLRIDRGSLAQDLSERGRTKRGVAIGQDRHPKDYGQDESTQASMGSRGQMAPALGISSESLSRTIPTRILLLSQQFL